MYKTVSFNDVVCAKYVYDVLPSCLLVMTSKECVMCEYIVQIYQTI